MSRTVKIALHLLLQYGLDMLDHAYADLPADQRAEPCVRQAMDALNELDDALATSLASTVSLEIANRSSLNLKLLEKPLSELAAAWLIAPEGLLHDAVIWRWKRRCAHHRRIALAEKKRRHVKR